MTLGWYAIKIVVIESLKILKWQRDKSYKSSWRINLTPLGDENKNYVKSSIFFLFTSFGSLLKTSNNHENLSVLLEFWWIAVHKLMTEETPCEFHNYKILMEIPLWHLWIYEVNFNKILQ